MVQSASDWPEWWNWELDRSNPHLAKRMLDRGFSETDLREMLQQAIGYRPDREPGRWIVETFHHARRWDVIVEPDAAAKAIIVAIAYAIG